LKFLGVFGGVAEIFWNMTPCHWVVVPDVAKQRIGLIFQGGNGREEAKKKKNMEFLGRLCCVDTWGTNHLVTRGHVPEERITLTNIVPVVFTE
jgi:hypothetical protein